MDKHPDRSYLPRAATIRAWTIQHSDCWRAFRENGILQTDGRRVARHFRPAYRWLMTQMRERIPGYQGGWPVWFWHSPKPDLRQTAHLPRGERGVRIEMELPLDRALLFDFDSWHCVLNRWHLSYSSRESREWDRKTEGLDQYRGPLPPRLERDLRESWQRVFDIELLRYSGMWGPIDRIQGVTEYVRLDEVRRVDEFVSR